MATQPAGNGSQIQIVPIAEACNEPTKPTRYQHILDELKKSPRDSAIKVQFSSKYLATQCAIGLRSLINSRSLDIGIRKKSESVFIWRLEEGSRKVC